LRGPAVPGRLGLRLPRARSAGRPRGRHPGPESGTDDRPIRGLAELTTDRRAQMAVETSYRVEQFINDVKAIVAADGVSDVGLARIAALMRRLTARDDLYPGLTHAELTDDHGPQRLHAE